MSIYCIFSSLNFSCEFYTIYVIAKSYFNYLGLSRLWHDGKIIYTVKILTTISVCPTDLSSVNLSFSEKELFRIKNVGKMLPSIRWYSAQTCNKKSVPVLYLCFLITNNCFETHIFVSYISNRCSIGYSFRIPT